MCGGRDKPCATCAFGISGCLTSMHEDNYCPASIEQVEERLKNGKFPNDKELMEKYVAYKKQKMIIWKPSMVNRQKILLQV